MTGDREKEIFADAAELPAGDREAFIADACAGDGAMRERLMRLLDSHDRAAEFMAAPTLEMGPRAGVPHASPDVGASIGPYTLEAILGEGGFGRVFRARQLSPVSRIVALKVLKSAADSGAISQRFEAERQALAVMDHPNVARVFDGGESEDGRPYFVMEFVRGEPITEFCERQGLTVRERVELFEKVCLAVQHAHHKAIVHRDLKPSNVMVTTVDDEPVPKVIDFGIAKAIGPQRIGEGARTIEGHLIGTPAYMSPEQISGSVDVDTRSDVYTLGVLLHEVLSGRPLFEEGRFDGVSPGELERIICQEDAPRPSTRVSADASRTRELTRELRGDLDWIVMKAMEKSPSRRYQTAFALASDLRRFLRDEPVEAGPPSGLYRFQKFARRRRGELLASAMVLVALVAGLVASLVFAARTDDARALTARELEKSEMFGDFAAGLLSGVGPAVARGEDTTILRQVLADAADRIDASPPEFPEVEAEMRELIGTAYYEIAAFDEAGAQFASALELARGSLGPHHARTLAIWEALARVHIETSRFEDARAELRGVLEGTIEAFGEEHAETASVLFSMAALDRLAGDEPAARDRFERVVEMRERLLGDRHEDTMSARNSLATVLDNIGETDRAAAMFEAIIEFQLDELGPDHPHTLATQNNLADAYVTLERLDEAAELMESVLATKRRVLDPEHPSVIVSLNNLASLYNQMGRADAAEPMFREALETCTRAFGEDDRRTLVLSTNFGAFLIKNERPEEAAAFLPAARVRAEAQLGEDHALTLSLLQNEVGAMIRTGSAAEAVPLAESLVDRARGALEPGHPSLAGIQRALGEALIESGAHQRAESLLIEVHGSGSISETERTRVAGLLADLYERLGDAERSARWREAAGEQP